MKRNTQEIWKISLWETGYKDQYHKFQHIILSVTANISRFIFSKDF